VGSDRHISDILIASLADVCLEKSLPLQRGFEDAAQLRCFLEIEVRKLRIFGFAKLFQKVCLARLSCALQKQGFRSVLNFRERS
jgi:hypothetical protein